MPTGGKSPLDSASRNAAAAERELRRRVERQGRRLKQAEADHATFLAHTRFIAVLGLLFTLPVVGGAYLGAWLDSLYQGYSVTWTIGMLLLGVALGAVNVYLFIRE